MDSIRQIVQSLLSDEYFKTVLRDQVQIICQQVILKNSINHSKSMIKDKLNSSFQNPQYNYSRQSVQVLSAVQQIEQTLLSLAKITITKETASFYQLINQRAQQMIKDNQNKFDQFIKIKQIQIQELIKTLKENNNQKKQKNYIKQKKIKLKQSKILIGKSLINLHQKSFVHSHSFAERFNDKSSNFDEKSLAQSIDQQTFFGFQNFQLQKNKQIENAVQIEKKQKTKQILQKIKQLEQSLKASKKQLLDNQKLIQQITDNQLKRLKQKFIDLKLKMQQKIDEGFSGIWNVVSLLEKSSSTKNSGNQVSISIIKNSKHK